MTNTRDIAAAREYLEKAERHLADAREVLRRAEGKLPEDLRESLAKVVSFTLTHENNGKTYEYAALRIRIAGETRWFTTGATCPPRGYTWRQLVRFINEARIGKEGIIELAEVHEVPF